MADRRNNFCSLSLIGFLFVYVTGCVATIPKDVLKLAPESLAQRQLQTRQYETKDEKKILSASTAVLQDLGFSLDESQTKLGVIVASKDRSAVNAGQVAVATTLVLLAAMGGKTSDALQRTDAAQKMRASLVTAPNTNGKVRVRVTFQRIVWNKMGQVSKMETLNDPTLYVDFFDKLSKSIFLQAHEI